MLPAPARPCPLRAGWATAKGGLADVVFDPTRASGRTAIRASLVSLALSTHGRRSCVHTDSYPRRERLDPAKDQVYASPAHNLQSRTPDSGPDTMASVELFAASRRSVSAIRPLIASVYVGHGDYRRVSRRGRSESFVSFTCLIVVFRGDSASSLASVRPSAETNPLRGRGELAGQRWRDEAAADRA